jgi:hypothetical protein
MAKKSKTAEYNELRRQRTDIIDQYRRHKIMATEAVRECNRIDSELRKMEG